MPEKVISVLTRPPPYSIITNLPSVIIPNYTPPSPTPTPTPTPTPLPEPKPTPKPQYERYSEDPDKVIHSYGLSTTAELDLIDLHHSAKRAKAKRERYDRYIMILSDYPKDYLAAYEAAVSAYDMTEYDKALHWVNKSLEIFPQYVPARQFKRKIEGGLKRTSD